MEITKLNDVAIYKQIVDNSRNPLECIREFISNSWDVNATEVDVEIIYSKEEDLNIRCKNNGLGLDLNEIDKYIFGAGHSTKSFTDESIGNKGIGTLLYLKCKKITIESQKGHTLSKATWHNPYAYLQNPTEITPKITRNAVTIDENNKKSYVQIYMDGYINSTDLTYYHHNKAKDYIKRFTKLGSIEPYLDNNAVANFNVRLKGLEFDEYSHKDYHSGSICIKKRGNIEDSIYTNIIDTKDSWEELTFGFTLPEVTSNESIINSCMQDENLLKIINTDVFNETERYKKYDKRASMKINESLVVSFNSAHPELNEYSKIKYYDNQTNTIKESILNFVIVKIGKKAREKFDDMLKTSKKAASYTENINKRYGVFLCRDQFPICQVDISNLPRLGDGPNGATQYLALFNNNDINLIMDRTAPSMDDALTDIMYENIYNAMKSADRLVLEHVDQIKKELNKKISEEKMKKLPLIININTTATATTAATSTTHNNNELSGYLDRRSNIMKEMKKREKLDRIKRFNNRKSVKLSNGVSIYEPTNEAELQLELIKVVSITPEIFDFKILDYNTTKGIDILAINKDANINNYNDYYYVELKNRLKPDMNHDMLDIKHIICWEISNELHKSCKIKDKLGNEYTVTKNQDGYKATNGANTVKIIELKDTIQVHFNVHFK